MKPDSQSDRPPPPSLRTSLAVLLSGHGGSLAALAGTSFVGGILEALFLVLASRAAFAITESKNSFHVIGSHSVTIREAMMISLILVVFRGALAVWAIRQSATLATDVVASTRRKLASAFLSATWPVQQAERSGRLQELLTTFTNQCAALLNNVAVAIVAAFNLIALLVGAVIVNPTGALIVILGATVLGSLLRPVRAMVRRRAQDTAQTGMDFASSLNEISQLGREVHVFHIQAQADASVQQLISRNAISERSFTFARGIVVPIYTSLAYLALIGALAFVATAAPANVASLGAVVLIMLRSLSYGQGIQNSYASVTGSLPFVERLHDKLQGYEAGRQHDGSQPIGSIGQIDVRDVSFSYDNENTVLRDLNLTIRAREVVGIVGPSGSGKSTLVELLLGLREPTRGSIDADDRPIKEMSRSEWARRVTFVPQAAHLVAGSIADNIRLMRDDVSQADIERAAELAHLSKDVAGFPEGYERQVGEHGGHLSGGQQQRLCIARALVERPDVLILDEPTSSLDVRSEHLIRRTLMDLSAEMTIIIIAHRLSTLDICDRIMVIQDGELKGFDTPESLAKSNAFYSEALALSGLE